MRNAYILFKSNWTPIHYSCKDKTLCRLGTFFFFFFSPIGAEGLACLISISCYHSDNCFNPTVTLGFLLSQDSLSLFYPLALIVHDVRRQWVSSHSLCALSAHEDSKVCRRHDSPTLLFPWQILFRPVIYIYRLTPSPFIAREVFSLTSVGFESSLYKPHMYPTGIY